MRNDTASEIQRPGRGAKRRSIEEILRLPGDPVLLPAEAADYARTTAPSLSQKRALGSGPAYLKVGAMVRYRRSALDAWLEGRTPERPDRHAATSIAVAA